MRLFVSVITLLLFTSCIEQWDRQLDSEQMTFKKIRIFPEEVNVHPSCMIYDNTCRLSVQFSGIKFAGITPDSMNNDNIKVTITFLNDKGVLQFSPGWTSYLTGETFARHNYFILSRYTSVFSSRNSVEFEFPMYSFHQLKKGQNDIYAAIVITQESPEKNHELFKGFYHVKLNVPEIYVSKFTCRGFELQNDSIWSPHGSDFSFGRGLPDLYWALYMPASDTNDYSNQYASTDVLWNAYDYIQKDSVLLFTYKSEENLIIGIYDFDRIGRDEYISQWFGSFSDLKSHAKKVLQFPHVNRFYYDFSGPDCINCE